MRRVVVPAGFLDEMKAGDNITLPAEQTHYVGDVLRLEEGDRIELFDGHGKSAVASLLPEIDGGILLEIQKVEEIRKGESPLRIILFQAVPKGKRWEWILEKATELGVDAVVPLETERTIVQLPEARIKGRLQRWEKILASASRQCGRSVVPEISAPLCLEDAWEARKCDLHLVAHPASEALTPGKILAAEESEITTVGVWIGPEGGFAGDEVRSMIDRGMRPISLGPRILRSDTAGIAALTLIQAACGDI